MKIQRKKLIFHEETLNMIQEIFLLNTSLTVEEKNPGSHIFYWKNFTDNVIKYICKKNKDCVFLLLGKHAQGKKNLIANKEPKKQACKHFTICLKVEKRGAINSTQRLEMCKTVGNQRTH